MNFNFCVISGKTISGIIKDNPGMVYDIVRDTYINHDLGNVVNPPSFFLKFPEQVNSRIIALPAALTNNEKIAGIKWIGSNTNNIKFGFPRASATIILNDYETCYPIACLEGSIISSLRTANSAVLAAKEILEGQKEIKSLGIIGNGLIAKNVVDAFLEQDWRFKQILLFDNNIEYAKNLANYINKAKNKDIQIIITSNFEDLIINANLIVLTTTTATPYIKNLKLFSHNPVILNVSLRDLAPEVVLNSNNIVDDISHILQANTSPHLAFQACENTNFINGTIGSLINNKIKLTHCKPIIFSPMGLGILDIAVAYCIYKKALEKKLTINIKEFFYDDKCNS